MDIHVVLVGIAALVAGGLIWLAADTASSRGARRGVLTLAIVQIGLFYVATADLLGRPKPVSVEMFTGRLDRSEVLAHHLRQDEAIFVWVRRDVDDPVSYALPWSEQTARELHEAGQQAEAGGGTVQLQLPRGDDTTEGGELSVGWNPPPAPPPKQGF